MKIASFNVNGIAARLPNLLRWLAETRPDVACLQELKAPHEKFPEAAIREAGYGVIWHGQKSFNGVAILARGADPVEMRRVLPGDPEDLHSRYIEGQAGGVLVGCLYLPNGNPAPGPKFDYKLRWLERLEKHAETLLALNSPVVLAGDYNVIPTELDVFAPERWVDDALFRPESRDAFARLLARGWTDALRRMHPDERIYTFWDYFRNHFERDRGLRVKYHPKIPPSYHLKLPPRLNPVRLRQCEKGHPGLATLYRTSNFHSLDGVSSLGLSRPALSFSLSRKLSPLMLIVIEWCSRRSRIALAITVSPKTSPQAPRL